MLLSLQLKVKYPDIYDRGTPNSKIRLNCAFMYIKMYSRGLRARLLCQVRGNSALDNTAVRRNTLFPLRVLSEKHITYYQHFQ